MVDVVELVDTLLCESSTCEIEARRSPYGELA